MRFLHTADWHLGRVFHEANLTSDQAHALEQLCMVAERERPEVILVAGDVFDRAVPPPDAISLLDRTLDRLLLELRIPVVMIPGNHDSAQRLGFGARLMRAAGLHLVVSLQESLVPIAFDNNRVGVDVFALPFAESAEVRTFLGDSTITDHSSAMKAMISRMREGFRPGRRRVLLAHAFVEGALTSESERPLSIGGTGTVNAREFSEFDYVALGHLHAPQYCAGTSFYSGSLLKYSFSEASHEKSVAIVNLESSGQVGREVHPITARRDVRCIEGKLTELLTAGVLDPRRDDYLHITLTDEGALLNALGRLREVYPNVMHIERRFLQNAETASERRRRREASEVELFRDFCREALSAEATQPEVELFEDAWRHVQRGDILNS